MIGGPGLAPDRSLFATRPPSKPSRWAGSLWATRREVRQRQRRPSGRAWRNHAV